MRISIILVLVPALLATLLAVGCGESKTVTKADGKELTLVQPASQDLKQGQTNRIAITVMRKGFDGEVDIDFDNLPSGVKVAEDTVVPSGDNMRTFTLVAADDATVVEKRLVTVKAKAEGMTAAETFELSVKPKG